MKNETVHEKSCLRVLIPGGAGFIGSHVACAFLELGSQVTIIDGILPETGGSIRNLPEHENLRFIGQTIEECNALPNLLNEVDLLVNCVAWTRHTLAMRNPLRDLELNLASQIRLIGSIVNSNCQNVIHLGSRGQYGSSSAASIHEDAPQSPNDIQAIHKIAAESHFLLAARSHGINVTSLRFGNTIGERQPMEGPDVGLFGGFLRELMNDGIPELYGQSRMREFLYAPDLAKIVTQIARHDLKAFNTFNVAGTYVSLSDLLDTIVRILGKGSYVSKEFPEEVKRMDIGSARLDGSKLHGLLGEILTTPLEEAIRNTVTSLAGESEN